jgi:hypothetical protein
MLITLILSLDLSCQFKVTSLPLEEKCLMLVFPMAWAKQKRAKLPLPEVAAVLRVLLIWELWGKLINIRSSY